MKVHLKLQQVAPPLVFGANPLTSASSAPPASFYPMKMYVQPPALLDTISQITPKSAKSAPSIASLATSWGTASAAAEATSENFNPKANDATLCQDILTMRPP